HISSKHRQSDRTIAHPEIFGNAQRLSNFARAEPAFVMKLPLAMFLSVTLCLPWAGSFAAQTADAEYEAVAEEYIKGHFAARPLEGTALGHHEYDGKIFEYSRLALDAELSRLRRVDDRLAKFDSGKESPRQSVDLRSLHAAVNKELAKMQETSVVDR